MSRIGKKPIAIPSGVDVTVMDDSKLIIKKGNLSKELDTCNRVGISIEDGKLSFALKGEDKASKAFWGTYRALASNIITGLTSGFAKTLEINGVGYRAAVNGRVLELQLGYSHPIKYDIPEGIDISVEKNSIAIKGADKQQVGQVAAEIRSFRAPEPYKGKGIKYSNETIIRKAGKSSKK